MTGKMFSLPMNPDLIYSLLTEGCRFGEDRESNMIPQTSKNMLVMVEVMLWCGRVFVITERRS